MTETKKKPVLLVFVALLFAACGSNAEETVDSGVVGAVEEVGTAATAFIPVPCPLTEQLVRNNCAVQASAILEASSGTGAGTNWCSMQVKTSANDSFGIPLITFGSLQWTDQLKDGYKNYGEVWDESGVGEEAFLTPLPGFGRDATKDDLGKRGYYLFVKKGDITYQFTGQPANAYSSCSVEQMRDLAREVVGD